MSMSVGRPAKGAIAEINVTPMADVMIVLLIIFMVATPIIAGAPVRLPDARHASDRQGPRLEIVVRANGALSAGEDKFENAEALADFLTIKMAGGDRPVLLVQADRGVDYSEVARVLAACRRAGSPEVALAARARPGQ